VEVLRESCGIAKHLVSETIVDKSLLRKIHAAQYALHLIAYGTTW
jgi:hypothetical protein